MWHLFSDWTGHSVPLGRQFFLQVLFRVCISVFASAAPHRGDPLGPNSLPSADYSCKQPEQPQAGEAVHSLALPVHK